MTVESDNDIKVMNEIIASYKKSKKHKILGVKGNSFWTSYNGRKSMITISNGECSIKNEPHPYKFQTIDGEKVKIDIKIYDLIKELNRLGIRTVYCCQGHRGVTRAYVSIYKDDLVYTNNVKPSVGFKKISTKLLSEFKRVGLRIKDLTLTNVDITDNEKYVVIHWPAIH